MEITFKVTMRARIEFDAGVEMYVAYVPALRIYSQGKTPAQAKTAIEDATESYLKVAHTIWGREIKVG